ncbi:MAG TPA: glycosyltransferase family 4 protein, partial [Acidimicrobiia bacterium]|nr:glycosyltransferase family 4 protein [Acidimicrobiia bacterium]
LVHDLGFKAKRVTVVPPGVDPRFSASTDVGKEATPLVVAVGRLVPVKRFDVLIDALCEAHAEQDTLRAVIVGEGYEREGLEALIHERSAESWISLPGRLDDDELIDLYRRAWVLVSMSAREGWGMTVTEAAACGTPAIATRIAGHMDAVVDGVSGILVDDRDGMAAALGAVIRDDARRARLQAGALEQAARFTWERTARGTLEVLAAEAMRTRGRPQT